MLGPNANHDQQRHHFYLSTYKGKQPEFFDTIEMCADTAATTIGRYMADNWKLEMWTMPDQSPSWWKNVIIRTVGAFIATVSPRWIGRLRPEHIPGYDLTQEPTNTEDDE